MDTRKLIDLTVDFAHNTDGHVAPDYMSFLAFLEFLYGVYQMGYSDGLQSAERGKQDGD